MGLWQTGAINPGLLNTGTLMAPLRQLIPSCSFRFRAVSAPPFQPVFLLGHLSPCRTNVSQGCLQNRRHRADPGEGAGAKHSPG